MEQINQEIKEIKSAMVAHNLSDDQRFSAILNKLDLNHDIHIRNEETLKSILEQTKRTNGRVTSLEDFTARLDKGNALLQQIVSSQTDEQSDFVSKEEFAPVKNLMYGGVALVITTVIIASLSLVIIKI